MNRLGHSISPLVRRGRMVLDSGRRSNKRRRARSKLSNVVFHSRRPSRSDPRTKGARSSHGFRGFREIAPQKRPQSLGTIRRFNSSEQKKWVGCLTFSQEATTTTSADECHESKGSESRYRREGGSGTEIGRLLLGSLCLCGT